jgi:hypothetical protein
MGEKEGRGGGVMEGWRGGVGEAGRWIGKEGVGRG